MPDSAWEALVAAHESVGRRLGVGADTAVEPRKHEPNAAILACSDARVPPSIVFDQPPGSLFVVRIAGNTAVPSAVASLDFAVEHLAVDLIVVLGHTHCGAVAAAVQGSCGGHLGPVVDQICEIARSNPRADADRVAALNVANTVSLLCTHHGPVGTAFAEGHLEIRGAIHDLASGELVEIELNRTPSPLEAS